MVKGKYYNLIPFPNSQPQSSGAEIVQESQALSENIPGC